MKKILALLFVIILSGCKTPAKDLIETMRNDEQKVNQWYAAGYKQLKKDEEQ